MDRVGIGLSIPIEVYSAMQKWVCAFAVCLLLVPTIAKSTSIAVMVSPRSIAIAADGWVSTMSEKHIPGPPKIALCGGRYICGLLGFSPGKDSTMESFLRPLQGKKFARIEDLATAIRLFSKPIFQGQEPVFKSSDDYWSQSGTLKNLSEIVVVGYDEGKPRACYIRIRQDKVTRTFSYPQNLCGDIVPGHIHNPEISHRDHMNLAWDGKGEESVYYNKILPGFISLSKSLLPLSSIEIRRNFAEAAALIKVESEFDSDIGGTISVGILQSNREPMVLQVPEL